MPLSRSYPDFVAFCDKEMAPSFQEAEKQRQAILPKHKKFSMKILFLGVVLLLIEVPVSFTAYDPEGFYTPMVVATLLLFGNLFKAVLYTAKIPGFLKKYAEIVSGPLIN